MARHDALHRRETDAGARIVLDAMKSLEGAEQLVRELHVEPGAVVANEVDRLGVAFAMTHLDPRGGGAPRELHRVGGEIVDHRLEQGGVGIDAQTLLDDHLGLLALGVGGVCLGERLR